MPLWLFGAPFLMDGCMGMFNLALPLFGQSLNLSHFEIGLAKGAATLPYVFVCLLAGSFSDHFGRRRIIIAGCTGIAVAYLLVPGTRGLWSFLVVCALVSTAQAFFWAPFQGWLGERRSGRGLSRSLILFNLSWSVGMMCGFLAEGHLIERGPSMVYWTAAGGSLIAAMLVWARRSPIAPPSDSPIVAQSETLPSCHAKYVRAHRLANFVSYFCIANVYTYFPLRVRELGWSPALTSHLVFIIGAVFTVVFPILGHTRRWHYRPFLMLTAQVAALTGMVGLGLTRSSSWLLLCLASIGMMLSVSYFSSLYYSVVGEGGLGRSAGWHESLLRSGDFLGGVAGGVAANMFDDLGKPFQLSAIVIAGGIVAFLWMICQGRAKSDAVPG